jgi:hypothetical protein
MTRSSIGETSLKVSDEPTRSPPIQCSVETSTPSISAVSAVGSAPLARRVVRFRTVWRSRSTCQTPTLYHPLSTRYGASVRWMGTLGELGLRVFRIVVVGTGSSA